VVLIRPVLFVTWKPGFDDVDSIYASPEDFRDMRQSNKAKGLHLLEFFVNKCHEIGVNTLSLFLAQIKLSSSVSINFFILYLIATTVTL